MTYRYKYRSQKNVKKYVPRRNRKPVLTRPVTTKFRNTVSVGKGFPRKMLMTHKYHEVINHNSISGVPGFYKFNCNGMYDPNNTGVGHQPYYFDQMSAIYDHYTVIGSKITINVVPTASPSPAIYVSLAQNDDAVQTNNTVTGIAEQSDGTMRLISPGATDTVRRLTNKWSAKKMFGGSVLGNDRLQGDAANNPAELTLWTIGLQAVDGVASVYTYIDVHIEYIAVWDELRDVVQS